MANGKKRQKDSDRDGLSDKLERKLGTDPHDEDTDGDLMWDGHEVALQRNPRVRGPVDATPQQIRAVDDLKAEMANVFGRPDEDDDGDGFDNWIERGRGEIVAVGEVDNLQPLDDFMGSVRDTIGRPYKYGAEVDPTDRAGGAAFDSSELVEWAAKQAGVRDMPDGAWEQYQYLDGLKATMRPEAALRTKGALLFGFSSDPETSTTRPQRGYVAISKGDGKTIIEVSERTGAVREVPYNPRLYQYGARVPGLHGDSRSDLDSDGYSDRYEFQKGGDITRGVTPPPSRDRGASLIPPDPSADPLGADRYAATDADDVALGESRHDDGAYGEWSADGGGAGDVYTDEPSGGDRYTDSPNTGDPSTDASSAGGSYPYDGASPPAMAGGPDASSSAPGGSNAADNYDDSYGDVADDSYGDVADESYGDASGSYV